MANTAAGYAKSRLGLGIAARKTISSSVTYVACVLIAIAFMAPFLWTVSTSLKAPEEIYVYPPTWIPKAIQWGNYPRVWQLVPYGTWFTNSTIVTVLSVIGQTLSCAVVAYGFARFRFPGRDLLFMLTLAALILPGEVTLIPTFMLFKYLGWLDKLVCLIVPNWFGTPRSAFYIFLLRQFFMTLPKEIDEAARVDGAGVLRVLFSIIMPLSKPALATAAILSFLLHWNEFLQALIFLNTTQHFTLPLGIRYFQVTTVDGGKPMEQLLMAASLMMTLPCIAFFFAGQRYFVRGIAMSGLKG